MQLKELLDIVKDRLKDSNIPAAEREAEIIVQEVLNMDNLTLFLDDKKSIDEEKIDRVFSIVKERIKRIPLAYILKKAWFRDLELFVDYGVFIPRPETEILVEYAIEFLKLKGWLKGVNILDLCTGSGVIALSIAKEISDVFIVASDISEKALSIAIINKKRVIGLRSDIVFLRADLVEAFKDLPFFHLVISNPPYVSFKKAVSIQPELSFEPEDALYSSDEGMAHSKTIIKRVYNMLTEGGCLIMETDPSISRELLDFVSSETDYYESFVLQDYAGLDRVIILKKGLNNA